MNTVGKGSLLKEMFTLQVSEKEIERVSISTLERKHSKRHTNVLF